MDAFVQRLYPAPTSRLPLSGIYLGHDLRGMAQRDRPYIYGNFITSLDDRISEFNARARRRTPPHATRHPHDWHLYLELAAQADAVITSGRRLRELGAQASADPQCVADLSQPAFAAWRRARGLAPYPACVVLSASLDLPIDALRNRAHAEMIVVTPRRDDSGAVETLRAAGVHVVETAGPRVTGDDVHRLAIEREYRTLYSIAGPEVFYTLVASRRLDRLYLSFALRLLAGSSFDTLLTGAALHPPADFAPWELYLDAPLGDLPGLLLASFERR